MLPQDEGGLVAYVAALCNWHRSHRFCAACGAPSELGEGGLIRACPRCGTHHHPRTDPVVIMLVTDADRVLLGRAPSWPPRRYSALAGFVEPGESLEEAVAREVAEESGVEVGPPRYVASQPWPFPSSLMLGFEAPYRSRRAARARGRRRGRALVQPRRGRRRGGRRLRGLGRPAVRRARCCCRRAWRSRGGCSSAGSRASRAGSARRRRAASRRRAAGGARSAGAAAAAGRDDR